MKFDVHSLVRTNIRLLTPYRCARDDYDRGILLDANENAIGSVPADPRDLNRYPDPHQEAFRARYAAFRGVQPANVFCGVGSDEAIDLLLRIFCRPGDDSILIAPPTYGMYKVSAAINDVDVQSIPLSRDFQLRVDDILAAVRPATKLIFLCSPNNPTGNVLHRQDIRRILLDFNGIVVVDEAYVDFSDEPSFAGELDAFENLVVLQTLSKSFGLAGIRLGLALASAEIIDYMMRVKAPYNINKLTTEVALKAMDNLDEMHRHVQLLNAERGRVADRLREIPAVGRIHPSDANFLLVEVPDALRIYREMADAGVVIRYRGDQIHCESTIRITIGTPEENDAMLTMLTEKLS
ncbi:MAG: histidinol-phosphate aminotransferase HisC [Bacteroidetes bacterium HLUCCA01]|nr:MAG: histidinol-phosphate aminotransferase HisC [Bacteroidetes bacterium HLUCCA01]